MQSEVDKAFSQSRKVSQRQGAWTGNLSTLTKDRVNLRLRSPKPLHGSLQTVHTLSPFTDRVSASLVRTQNQRFCNHALRFGTNSKVRTTKNVEIWRTQILEQWYQVGPILEPIPKTQTNGSFFDF